VGGADWTWSCAPASSSPRPAEAGRDFPLS
jgi:hypothetical protein